MCNGATKQVSAGVAPCNMVGFVKLFRTSVARQVSRKVERLFYFQQLTTVAVVNKKEFHRATPLRETCLVRSCHATLHKPIRNRNKSATIHGNNILRPVPTFPNQIRHFMLHSAMPAETCFQRCCAQVSA